MLPLLSMLPSGRRVLINYDPPRRSYDEDFSVTFKDSLNGRKSDKVHCLEENAGGEVEVIYGRNDFEMKIDLHHFQPNEIEVKVVDNWLVVEGKHEEKTDIHGLISRQFKRRFILPENARSAADIICHMSSDGVLEIKVEREKIITIVQTGRPAYRRSLNLDSDKVQSAKAIE